MHSYSYYRSQIRFSTLRVLCPPVHSFVPTVYNFTVCAELKGQTGQITSEKANKWLGDVVPMIYRGNFFFFFSFFQTALTSNRLLENTNISGCLACQIADTTLEKKKKKKKHPVCLTEVSEVLPFISIVCLSDTQLQGTQEVSHKSLMSTFSRSYGCFLRTAMSRGNIPWLSAVPHDESQKYFLPDGSAHLIWKARVSICWCWRLRQWS